MLADMQKAANESMLNPIVIPDAHFENRDGGDFLGSLVVSEADGGS